MIDGNVNFQLLDDIKIISDIWEIFDRMQVKIFIAGGCFTQLFTNGRINDVDVFFKSKDDLDRVLPMIDNCDEFSSMRSNEAVKNLKYRNLKVQLILKYFFESEEQIFNEFDFTIVKACYDGDRLKYHERFFIDLAKKRLVPNENLVKPLSTFKRMVKYISRGYSICPVGQSRIAKNINNLKIDWDNPEQNQIDFYPDGTPTFRGID